VSRQHLFNRFFRETIFQDFFPPKQAYFNRLQKHWRSTINLTASEQVHDFRTAVMRELNRIRSRRRISLQKAIAEMRRDLKVVSAEREKNRAILDFERQKPENQAGSGKIGEIYHASLNQMWAVETQGDLIEWTLHKIATNAPMHPNELKSLLEAKNQKNV